MEDGNYRVQVELLPRVKPPTDDAEARRTASRMLVYLPVGARLVDAKAHPESHTVTFTLDYRAPGVLEACVLMVRAVEHLDILVRREHGAAPIGPAPEFVRTTITHNPAPDGEPTTAS